MSCCSDCIHREVCGDEGWEDEALEFCADKIVSCEDAIIREAVVKAIDEHTREDGTLDDDITVILENLPSVEPVRPKGKWVNSDIPDSILSKCTNCGFNLGAYTHNFCPNCGADMRGE